MKFRSVYINDEAFNSTVKIVDDFDKVYVTDVPAIDARHYIEYLNFKYNITDDNDK